MVVYSQHFTESDFTPATNLRRRLKKNSIPTQKIPKIPPCTKQAVIDRSKRHWLQKCTLNMMEETSTNTEAHDENIPPLTTKTGILIPFFSPLSHIFYEEKATENNYQRTRARTNTRIPENTYKVRNMT
ncbi:hypothetical protein QE152_g38577 [Popillia japonica]|uniref:Uncharacterized protein n=1 Tax=Popillia japonica TaxID=7064 RepID=A0AAW1HW84_POPJA